MGTSKNRSRSAAAKTAVRTGNAKGTNVGSSGKPASGTAPSPADAANAERMAITPRGLRLLLVGLIVMISGYILMIGGGSKDPAVFNYAMFDFRRLVAAPLMILLGVVIEIISIVKVFGKGRADKNAKDKERSE